MKILLWVSFLVAIIAAGVFLGNKRSVNHAMAVEKQERLEYRKQLQSDKYNVKKKYDTGSVWDFGKH